MFAPGGRGGAQRHTDQVVDMLCDHGWRVRMVVRQTYATRFRVRRRPSLFCLEVPGFGGGRPGVALYLLGMLVTAPWARRAFVVLGVRLPWPATAAALAGWVFRLAFIVFSTGSGELSDVEDLRLRRSSALRIRLTRRAAWLVTQTDAGAREAAGLVAPHTITVVPNPVTRAWAPLPGDEEMRRTALAQIDARLDDFSPLRVGGLIEGLIASARRPTRQGGFRVR